MRGPLSHRDDRGEPLAHAREDTGMGRIHEDNSLCIGQHAARSAQPGHEGARRDLVAKIEGRNPAYSVKCRIGAA